MIEIDFLLEQGFELQKSKEPNTDEYYKLGCIVYHFTNVNNFGFTTLNGTRVDISFGEVMKHVGDDISIESFRLYKRKLRINKLLK